ncbi:MAG: Na+ dependent nucleoside transporter [Cryomorphaceae bacterium]|nr:Na+ dependent nucleoside transporter [Cryomorphaceae bacterium]
MMRLYISLLLLVGFVSIGAAQQSGHFIEGNWNFAHIRKIAGNDIFEIAKSDTFFLAENGSFNYFLAAKNNLVAKGEWSLANDTLALNYHLPMDTVRYYLIRFSELGDSLFLFESGVEYGFARPPKKVGINNLQLPPWEPMSLIKGILGLSVLLFMGFLLSKNRRRIRWSLILKGLGIQIIFAVAILKIDFVRNAFDWISGKFVLILSFTRYGTEFLFGNLITDTESLGFIFAFQVLPTVVFFSALTSLLFYYGVLQKVVFAFAWVMRRTLKLSGAESLSAAGNIFLGQTESPLLVKPYLEKMTNSELLCVMTGGMATIAGGVLAAYIGFLGGTDVAGQIFFAKHLIAASVMSAPAAIISAKLLYPETEPVREDMKIAGDKMGSNALEAISTGTTDGLKLAINVGAMLLVFIALIYMFNYIFRDGLGALTGLNPIISSFTDGQYDGLTMQFILGYALAPLTFLMGVNPEDMILVGQLLGEKTILNEFVAYVSLGNMMDAGVFHNPKSIIIATYILCGFSNFASIGIQIGGIGALAPSRRSDLSRLGVRALIAGTMASLFTAVVVGMLI